MIFLLKLLIALWLFSLGVWIGYHGNSAIQAIGDALSIVCATLAAGLVALAGMIWTQTHT
jgi:hypothetical protein